MCPSSKNAILASFTSSFMGLSGDRAITSAILICVGLMSRATTKELVFPEAPA